MKRIFFGLFLLLMVVSAFAALPEVTQVSYTPSPAVPGSTITVFVQIESNDSAAKKDVSIGITNKYPFTVKEDTNKFIGNLDSYGKAVAEFIVYVDPSAQNQTYILPVTVTDFDNASGKTTEQSIIISGKEPTLAVVESSEEQLVPGQEKELTFTIQNIGTSTAYDVLVELQEDRTVVATGTIVEREIIPLGATSTYIASIAPGEQKTATLKLSVNRNATLKNYTLPVTMAYRNSSGLRTTNTSYIGLKISGTVDIDATIKDITKINGLSEMTIEIFNKGAGKAEFMTATIEGTGYFDKPKQFIGSLEPNDVDSFKTKLDNTNQTVTVTLSYQDTDATIKTKTFKLTTNTAPKSEEQGNILIPIVVIIVLAILAWVGYTRFIKKK